MERTVTLKSLKEEVDSLEHFVENTSSELENALIRMSAVTGMVKQLIEQEAKQELKNVSLYNKIKNKINGIKT